MTNTYGLPEHDFGNARRLQQAFLDDHHHLINPILFTEKEIVQRNALLHAHRWKVYEASRRPPVGVVPIARP